MNRRRLRALLTKEMWQVLRDPSTLIIAFVLPPILLLLLARAVSLDVEEVPMGLVQEGDGAHTRSLAAAYRASPWLEVTAARHRWELERDLVNGRLMVLVVIPADFDARLNSPQGGARVQIISDGSEPNSANFGTSYARGVFNNWLAQQPGNHVLPMFELQPRFWFNPELESRRVLVSGSIALVMTIIGTLLTAMVIAREWERGTMEALLATSTSTAEILLSKLLPYFCLAILAVLGCTFMAEVVYGTPLRGSLAVLLLISTAFLAAALGQGLLISTLSRNQFHAAELAVMTGFLPALILSGFVFEIQSMPEPVQWLTQLVPARYLVSSLQTVYLVGDVWADLWPNLLAMLLLGGLLFALTFAFSRGRLD